MRTKTIGAEALAASEFSGSGLAGRYAAALFELAEEKSQLDQVASDLASFKRMTNESADLRRLLASPILSREEQARALKALVEAAGFADLTCRFVQLVAANRRLFALGGMIDAFLAALAKRRGEVTAKVKSARPLDAAQVAALSEALRRAIGSKVEVDLSVDEELLGGLVVQVGSRLIDGSLKTKLEKLSLTMKGTM